MPDSPSQPMTSAEIRDRAYSALDMLKTRGVIHSYMLHEGRPFRFVVALDDKSLAMTAREVLAFAEGVGAASEFAERIAKEANRLAS